MSKINCRVYADFGFRKTERIGHIAVPDTGVAINIVSPAQVPEEVDNRKIGMDPNISDANGDLLKISGINFPFIYFGTYVIKMDLFVYERLE